MVQGGVVYVLGLLMYVGMPVYIYCSGFDTICRVSPNVDLNLFVLLMYLMTCGMAFVDVRIYEMEVALRFKAIHRK